jgi:hypothetical protein
MTGTYQWTASYSGDANNLPAESGCGLEPVVIIGECEVLIDKQVSCEGATGNPHDDQLVSADDDDINGCTTLEGNDITITYEVNNPDPNLTLINCVLTDRDKNGSVIREITIAEIQSGVTWTSDQFIFECNDEVEALEPDTATVVCECAENPNQDPATLTAFDRATFDCPGCNVDIEKDVAADTDCDGEPDNPDPDPFSPSVTVAQTECVVYRICVTNTGEQDLDTSGVKVQDMIDEVELGIGIVDFGTIQPDDTVCVEIPGIESNEEQATLCPGDDQEPGTEDDTCVCDIVEGENTVEISSAVCFDTGDDACDIQGSICDSSALVECTRDEFCRTPGYWGTHEDQTAYALSLAAPDPVEVCGGILPDEDCAIEGICNAPGKSSKETGFSQEQLKAGRNLVATLLNCLVTNGSQDCDGVSIGEAFGECDAACSAGDDVKMATWCPLLDCWNNGGNVNGTECTPFDGIGESCHDREFPDDFPTGHAEPGQCKIAKQSRQTLFTDLDDIGCLIPPPQP